MSQANTRKRVRFSVDEPDTAMGHATETEAAIRPTLLPQPIEDVEVLPAASDEGPIKSTDPGLAAALRAQHRKEIDNLQVGEALDVSLLDEIAAAEEDDEDIEQRFTEDGIPIEPFNLRSERAQGYFGTDGNYVAYRADDDTDAWLETLPAGPIGEGSQQVHRASDQADDNVERRPKMTDLDKESYRQRIVGKLQPGETVLEALKRLGTPENLPEQTRESKAERLSAMRSRLAGTVPQANKVAFNALTEDAGQLLNAGDTSIYTKSREELVSGLERSQVAARVRFGESRNGISLGASNGGSTIGAALAARLAGQPAEGMEIDGDNAATPAQAPADPEADIFAEAPAQGREQGAAEQTPPREIQESSTAVLRNPQASIHIHGQPAVQAAADGIHSLGYRGLERDRGAAMQTSSQPLDMQDSHNSQGGGDRQQGERAAQSAIGAPEQAGFVFDDASNLWYNSSLGVMYDSRRQLYGDAASGRWYTYNEDGKYEIADGLQ